MVFFFTSVGFQANLKVLKSGGKSLIVFLFLVIMLIVMQNFSAIGLANLIGLDSLTGMTTGSIPMVGGHGTAGAFGPVLEDFGVQGATTVCTAAATFGLIAGSLMGGPVGNRLIKKHNLIATIKTEDDSLLVEEEEKHERHFFNVCSGSISADYSCRTRYGCFRFAFTYGHDIPDLYRCNDCCCNYEKHR